MKAKTKDLPKEKLILEELSKQNHKNIIRILDHFTEKCEISDSIFLVFEKFQVKFYLPENLILLDILKFIFFIKRWTWMQKSKFGKETKKTFA